MIEKCYFLKSALRNPYQNQALKEYLMTHIPENSLILLLYNNDETIQLANNSCVFRETRYSYALSQRVYFSRDLPKGETVYQDNGCLNFAFFVYKNNYNVARNVKVITDTLRGLKIPAYFDQVSSVQVDGKQVCSNQYYIVEESCMHQGSIYVDVDLERRERLLRFDDDMIKTPYHNVVKDVGNLTQFEKDLTMAKLREALLQQYANEFGNVYEMEMPDKYMGLIDNFYSYDYIFLRESRFTLIVHDIFAEGQAELYLDVDHNRVVSIDVYGRDIAQETITSFKKVFTSMLIDDVTYRQRLFRYARPAMFEDMNKVYMQLRKYSL
ncbi:MAG: hypothetical protein IJM15_07430 [Erysipelotrichaceae bacterium]|nr:hypothetical protein [Erysipelotrichaceae bacterium]